MSATTENKEFSVMFVCLGNICRSPMAEAVFAHLVNINGYSDRFLSIDSSGTAGYHVNESPDHRSTKVCKKYGVSMRSVAQQLKQKDFQVYDYIVAMDDSILSDIKQVQPPSSKALIKLFGDFGDGRQVKDPYYGRVDGFEENFKQCVEYSLGFLRTLGFSPTKFPEI